MYLWAVCAAFTNVKIINSVKVYTLDLYTIQNPKSAVPLRAANRMLLSAAALVRSQSSGRSFCHHNTCRGEKHWKTQASKQTGIKWQRQTVQATDHVSVLQVVIGISNDSLRTSVQQLFYAAFVLPPSGGAEEVQAEAPQGVGLRDSLQQRQHGVDGQGGAAEEGLETTQEGGRIIRRTNSLIHSFTHSDKRCRSCCHVSWQTEGCR